MQLRELFGLPVAVIVRFPDFETAACGRNLTIKAIAVAPTVPNILYAAPSQI